MMPLKQLPMNEISMKYLEGADCSMLARIYGVNRMTITNHLKRNGIEIRPRTKTFDLEIAKKLYNDGNTCQKIAKKLNVTEWAINKKLKNIGFPLRDNHHPARKEQSRRLMSERMEQLGNIRIGKHEPMFCQLLKEKYNEVFPQYKIEKGGHHFDAYAGGILWELDEREHKIHQDRIQKDIKYDSRAKELGYEVRHVWEWDFFDCGIEKWHYTISM